MVFASGPGQGLPPRTPTLADLLVQSRVALGCAILLLAVLLIMGIVYRRDRWRFWPRKTVVLLVVTVLLALAVAQQAWSLHRSLIRDGVSPDATYADVNERISSATANQLDVAVGTFGLWSTAFVLATFTLLCVVGKQLVTSLRSRQHVSREVFHTIGLPSDLSPE